MGYVAFFCTFKGQFELADNASQLCHFICVKDFDMDAHQEPVISGPMFPHGNHDREPLPPSRLKGTIIGVRPGRRAEDAAQILTIKLEDWEQSPNQLLNTDVDLIFHLRS